MAAEAGGGSKGTFILLIFVNNLENDARRLKGALFDVVKQLRPFGRIQRQPDDEPFSYYLGNSVNFRGITVSGGEWI